MRILISLVGRFHSEEIATGFKNFNYNVKVISSYPYFVFKKALSRKEHESIGIIGIINRFNKYLPHKIRTFLNLLVHRFVSKKTLENYKEFPIIIIWSGCAYEFLKNKNSDVNNKVILERGSTHISYQVNLLKKLYNDLNFDFKIENFFLKEELEEYKLSDYIAIPSNFCKKTFVDNGISEEKLFVNPYGVNLNNFYIKKYNKHKIKKKLIFCGEASIRKGFFPLLETLNKLSKDKIEIIHVGTVSEEIKKILKSKRYDNLKILGTKKQNELKNYFYSADALILPSYEEGMALVQLQSLACGTPIISSIQAGVDDIFDSNEVYLGEKINKIDPTSISESVINFYDNVEKINTYEIFNYVKNNFSTESYSQRYLNFIKKIKP